MITQAELMEWLDYDATAGIFTWKQSPSREIKIGQVAGCKNSHGYIQIRIKGKRYYGHRLAWLFVYGYLPEHEVDHLDRVCHHNWITNLREVSHRCNLRNTDNPSHNTSGVKGVTWFKPTKTWMAHITIKSKTIGLGYYHDFSDAVCARLAAEQCLDWSDCGLSSPAYRYVANTIQCGAEAHG